LRRLQSPNYFQFPARLSGGPDHARERHRRSAPGKSRMTAEVIDLAMHRSARAARDMGCIAGDMADWNEALVEFNLAMGELQGAMAQFGYSLAAADLLNSGIPQAPCDVEA
jgi:hypothetical protein